MQYKLRKIAANRYGDVMGLTCPQEIAIFFKEVVFTIQKSGTAIIYASGTSQIPTTEQIKNYQFEDLKVQ